MCLRSRNWLKRLTLFSFFFCSPLAHAIALWSLVGATYNLPLNKDGSFSTTCKLSSVKKLTDGDPSAPRVDVKTIIDDSSLVINYGDGERNSIWGDGFFKYAEKFEFSSNLSSSQSATANAALKTALMQGRCDIAESLLSAMVQGDIHATDEGDKYIGFSNGEDKCIIRDNGDSLCRVKGPTLECNAAGQDCQIAIGNDKELNLQQYANSEQKEKEILSSPDSGQGSPSITSYNGSSSTGTASSNSGSQAGAIGSSHAGKGAVSTNSLGKENQSGHHGSKGGHADGKGKGDEEGLANMQVEHPNLKEFNIKSALFGLKSKLKQFTPELSMPGGQCPTLAVPIFNTTKDINVHCQVFEQHGSKLSAIFLLIWGFLAIRILLSA